MPTTQIWRSLLILIFCLILGGLPLIQWITAGLTGRQLTQLGTGNVSVSAAFYHGGRWVGILAVLSEALKGLVAVGLARYCFPHAAVWEIVALIALAIGRYSWGRGAGTTNVVWGYVAYDWVGAALIFLLSISSFTILRNKQQGRIGVLVLLPLITAFRHPQAIEQIGATAILSLLLGWIYQNIPDDLELAPQSAQGTSQSMFQFLRGGQPIPTLDQPLGAANVGQKAATLSQLLRWGYPVPRGWALPAGTDPAALLQLLQPTIDCPLVVRSSAVGEDSADASAAGQYESILNVTDLEKLKAAIDRCRASYDSPVAAQYRRDQGGWAAGAMSVLIQIQVQGVFSGVAFSRDPIARQGNAVAIEALPGAATTVVSGRVTPEQYRVWVEETDLSLGWELPETVDLTVEGTGEVPSRLIQQVAYLARHLEAHYHGVPQDIEWSYDGDRLWLLQARPITTLLPIWTRKIAAEVIPGWIRPLTWSINRPLTCGVWGEIFTLVLGDSTGLDFDQTATLHHSAAYFNASLLGEIFRRMGLPPESLEFLTRGAKFSKPPLRSTLKNLPGLWRLWRREQRLIGDFERDRQQRFMPGFAALESPQTLSPQQLLDRIDRILELLRPATYYSILAPLSFAFRKAIAKVADDDLDYSQTPEVASLRSLQALANDARSLLTDCESVWTTLAKSAAGQQILQRFEEILNEYGYLSDVATDIAVPTWRENPQFVQNLFVQMVGSPMSSVPSRVEAQAKGVQRRLNLKGQVTIVYSRLLAELRSSFVALEQRWLNTGLLAQPDDIFFLTFAEIRELVAGQQPMVSDRALPYETLTATIAARRSQREEDQQMPPPHLVYGNDPPVLNRLPPVISAKRLKGIGASPGCIEGRVLVLRNLQAIPDICPDTILVVPYTDAGWAPLLSRAIGLIAEAGGRLSHGAIVAREYGIPAVMDVQNAIGLLSDGQRVRLDGEQGTIDLVD